MTRPQFRSGLFAATVLLMLAGLGLVVACSFGSWPWAVPLAVLVVVLTVGIVGDAVLEAVGRQVYPGDGRYTGVER